MQIVFLFIGLRARTFSRARALPDRPSGYRLTHDLTVAPHPDYLMRLSRVLGACCTRDFDHSQVNRA